MGQKQSRSNGKYVSDYKVFGGDVDQVDTWSAPSLRRYQQVKYPGWTRGQVNTSHMDTYETAKLVSWDELVPHTCDHCRHIVIDSRKRLESSDVGAGGVRKWELPLGMGLSTIVDAALDGCLLLDWVVRETVGNIWYPKDSDDSISLSIVFDYGNDMDNLVGAEFWSTQLERPTENFPFRKPLTKQGHSISGDELDKDIFETTRFDIIADRSDPASKFVRLTPPETDISKTYDDIKMFLSQSSGSEERWALTQRRLTELTPGKIFPARLIDVGKSPSDKLVCLVDSRSLETSATYAALSYVWGGDQPGKTTTLNIKAHFVCIALSDLPTTLRDAVQVTREIGLRYLWIDSLCILQDDKQDQAVEIAKMPEYYGNASITIVAGESCSAYDGFLQKPSIKPIYSDFAFQLPYSSHDGQSGSVKFISRQEVKFENLPINSRGWTYQEALLSSHLVVFHQNGVELCCNRDCHGSADNYVQSVTRVQLDSLRQLAAETSSSARTLLEAWPTIVYTYSSRNLTNSSDKLLAISGIATEMGRTLPYNYKAGLWVPDDKSQWPSLIWQLLWCAGSGIIDCFPSKTYGDLMVIFYDRSKRLRDYRAPSWSWAAIDELTGYPPAFDATSEPVHQIMHFEILDISVELEHPQAPFGAVIGGRLVVRARLKAAKHMRQLLFMPDTVEDEEMFKNTREHGKIWCALILHVWDVFRGLVLKEVAENTYQRIGCFSFDNHSTEVVEKMFKHSQDREIVII